VMLLEAIDEGQLGKAVGVQWTSRFASGPVAGGAVAILNVIVLMNAVQSGGAQNTLSRWATITSSLTGTAEGVATVLGRWSALVEKGIVRAPIGRALGVIGAVAGIVAGIATAKEEFDTGDTTGMWIAIAGAVGGAISLAGVLIGAGAATTSTVGGAPVGVVLMVAGAAIGVGAAAAGWIRDLALAGSEKTFEEALTQFGRANGPFDVAAAQRQSLRDAFQAVQAGQHATPFWDVDPEVVPQLSHVGFGPEQIALIVDESEDEVRQRLSVDESAARGGREAVPVP
jgi:hypothetical protein